LSRRLLLAAGVAAVALSAAIAAGRGGALRVDDVRCIRGCAGARAAATGSAIRFEGRRLGQVSEVRFTGETGPEVAAPVAANPRTVKVLVPDGAVSGRPRLLGGGQADRSPKMLRIVSAGELPAQGAFVLERARLRPHRAYFDDRRRLRIHYRFAAYGPRELKLRLVRHPSGKVIRTLEVNRALPYATGSRRWNGLNGAGGVPANGRYVVRVEPAGGPSRRGKGFEFHRHRFPVRGPHSYGGPLQRFGAPRSGGRTHEGQDVYAACGTRLEAARGGRVQARAYDARLNGYYLVIDGRKTRADHLYAHLRSPSPARGRVRTEELIGRVGKTGNARTTPCHLHFESWPRGWHHGAPTNPLRHLRRWDRWS
jgi:murein DD-endopeptidase MepM/ murein hydrolase activator NlpD